MTVEVELLPFMKPKKAVAGVIMHDMSTKPAKPALDETEEIQLCVEAFMSALQSRDTKRMAELVKIAHDILHQYMDKER